MNREKNHLKWPDEIKKLAEEYLLVVPNQLWYCSITLNSHVSEILRVWFSRAVPLNSLSYCTVCTSVVSSYNVVRVCVCCCFLSHFVLLLFSQLRKEMLTDTLYIWERRNETTDRNNEKAREKKNSSLTNSKYVFYYRSFAFVYAHAQKTIRCTIAQANSFIKFRGKATTRAQTTQKCVRKRICEWGRIPNEIPPREQKNHTTI